MQLINITTVPISIELKSSGAQLQRVSGSSIPELNISREKGGLKISSDPIRLKLDTYESKKSMGQLPPKDIVPQAAEKGLKIAYQATVRYVNEGNQLSDTTADQNPIPNIAKQYFNRDIETMLSFIPSVGPDISWDGGTINIQYTTDELNIDWQSQRPQFEFVPPTIELSLKERPQVIIEYLGGPIYVPASSDPNYTPLDTEA